MNEYEMELNAVVNWEDADGKKHTGVLVDTITEADGCGHFLALRNFEDGIDEVPLSMVVSAVNPNGKVIRPNE
jgi:uncharacterized protein YijF (DUF1287 family)